MNVSHKSDRLLSRAHSALIAGNVARAQEAYRQAVYAQREERAADRAKALQLAAIAQVSPQ